MRLPLAFLGACLMALGLFGLMLYMVAPPRSQPSDKPLTVANFVRLDGDSSNSASRTRLQAPQPPQPQNRQPQPPAPQAAAPSASLPALDLPLPNLSSGISVSSAPAPSLSGFSAGAAAPSVATPGAPSPAESGGHPGGAESEVMPLNEVSPEYPRYALQRGIEGHVKLAFTINRAGSVENVRVLEAKPVNVFEREARRAAVRWRFAPRSENGLAVAREAVKTLYFRLEGGH